MQPDSDLVIVQAKYNMDAPYTFINDLHREIEHIGRRPDCLYRNPLPVFIYDADRKAVKGEWNMK